MYNPARKIDGAFGDIIKNFKSKDIMRISIATGSSGIIDKYIDKRQKEIVSESISDEQIRYVLDAGMGAGRWTDFFCNRSIEYAGIDISPKMIAVAKANLKRKNASFIICTNTDLPFKDDTFDLAFSCFSLLYLIDDKDFNKAVRELIRVTKPMRKIIVADIMARRPTKSSLMHRRTPSQYVKAFSTNGSELKEVNGCYIDYPVRVYQFIIKKLIKTINGSSGELGRNVWIWLEKRGGSFRVIIESPVRLIILIMRPLDKFLLKSTFSSVCPEKIFIFKKGDENGKKIS